MRINELAYYLVNVAVISHLDIVYCITSTCARAMHKDIYYNLVCNVHDYNLFE